MKAISIRQPWAWLILNAGKDIENRTWSTNIRGRVLIHAAKGMTLQEHEDASEFAWRARKILTAHPQALDRGGIVGSVEIIDCVSHSDSPWFVGPYGFVLARPEILPFRSFKGVLGFFDVPDDLLSAEAS